MVSKFFVHLRAQWMGALALFLVIAGGTAYASNTVFSTDIVDGQVNTADLANNSVRTAKIATGQVQAADVKNESLTGADVADQSIGSQDLNTDSVGLDELQLGAIPAFAYIKQAVTANDTTSVKELTVTCPPGRSPTDTVTGGGYVVDGADAYILRDYAVSPGTWLVRAASVNPSPGPWQLTVVANCTG